MKPYDNTQPEANWSTVKTELMSGGRPFAKLEKPHLEVDCYLNTSFYLNRRHYFLGTVVT